MALQPSTHYQILRLHFFLHCSFKDKQVIRFLCLTTDLFTVTGLATINCAHRKKNNDLRVESRKTTKPTGLISAVLLSVCFLFPTVSLINRATLAFAYLKFWSKQSITRLNGFKWLGTIKLTLAKLSTFSTYLIQLYVQTLLASRVCAPIAIIISRL